MPTTTCQPHHTDVRHRSRRDATWLGPCDADPMPAGGSLASPDDL